MLTGAAAAEVRTDARRRGSPACASPTTPCADLDADLVVFAAGIRPRDELARAAGLDVGERGGVVVDDACATSAPGVFAIGEVALPRRPHLRPRRPRPGDGRRSWPTGSPAATPTFTGADLSTRLKLLGVDVATVGDPHAAGDEVVVSDPTTGVWKRAVLDGDGRRARRRRSSATPRRSGRSCRRCASGTPLADVLAAPRARRRPAAPAGPDGRRRARCAPATTSTPARVRAAVGDGHEDVPAAQGVHEGRHRLRVVRADAAGPRSTSSRSPSGAVVVKRLCPHFAMSRAELFDVVRVTGIRTFAELVDRHGTGRGCEICKPTVASMFASLASATSSTASRPACRTPTTTSSPTSSATAPTRWCPACPAARSPRRSSSCIGEVARDFDLYTKITGGQRIDLLGARVDDLPAIWRAAGRRRLRVAATPTARRCAR